MSGFNSRTSLSTVSWTTPLNQDEVSGRLSCDVDPHSQPTTSALRGHADTYCGHMLEGIRHGKEQNVHGHPINNLLDSVE